MIREEIYKALNKNVSSFFPETGSWDARCFKKPNDLFDAYFPCHTRDIDWLSKKFRSKYNLYYLSLDFIKDYMRESGLFNLERYDYEQRVVVWQINWMNNGGENWIVDSELGGDLYILTPQCDIVFRKGIVDTLLAIGMPYDAIEEGIEKNIDVWRPGYINLAFRNKFDPYMYKITKADNNIGISDEFRESWIKMRLYEYYQNHKDSVDKYGTVLPEMLMTEEEVSSLKEYLDKQSEIRLRQLEENRINVKSLKL